MPLAGPFHHDLPSRGAAPFAARRWRIALAFASSLRRFAVARRRCRRAPTARSRRSSSPPRASREALGRSTADVVVIDADDDPQHQRRFGRGPDPPRSPACRSSRNGGPGQSSGFFIRGAEHEQHRRARRRRARRLGDARPGRVRGAEPGADRAHRGAARAGVEPLRCRRGRRRGPDLHPPRRRRAALERGGAKSAATARRAATSARAARTGAWDYALSLGREKSDGVSAIAPGDVFGSFNPDDDGFSRKSGALQLGFTPAPGHRIGVSLLETRLNAQYDSHRVPPFLRDPSPDFRNHLMTRVAAIDYRGTPIDARWTTTLQPSRAVDDLTSGGTTTSRFVTEREQATWQNALALAADQQLVLAYEHLDERASARRLRRREQKRHNNAGVLGYSGAFDAHRVAGRRAPRRQLRLRRQHDGPRRLRFDVARGVKLRALAGTTFRAPTFNDLAFPGFGVPTDPARARPQRRGRRELARRRRDRVGDGLPQPRPRPDRLRARSHASVRPTRPTPSAAPPTGQRARLQGATLAATARWRELDLRAQRRSSSTRPTRTPACACRAAPRTRKALAPTTIAGAWRLGASALFVGSRPDSGVVLGGYGVVDLRVAWQPRRSGASRRSSPTRSTAPVEPVRDYRGLGRQAWLGVRYDRPGFE